MQKSLSGTKYWISLSFPLKISFLVGKKTFVSEEELTLLDWSSPWGEEAMPWSFASVVPPPEAGEGTGTSAAEQNPAGCDFWRAAAKGLLAQGWAALVHTQPLAPFPPGDWLLSTEGLGLEDVCGNQHPTGCLETQPQ